MAFSLVTRQMRQRIKTVTRRTGWKDLSAGDRVMAVEKGQGLKKGEKVVKLGELLILDVRQERVSAITDSDVIREGFQGMSREEFIQFFCKGHNCKPSSKCTRIEFQWVDNLREGEKAPGTREIWRQVASLRMTNATHGVAEVCNGFGEISEIDIRLGRLEWESPQTGLVPWGKAKGYINGLLMPGGKLGGEVLLRENPVREHGPWICDVEFQKDGVWWNLSEHLANREDLGYRRGDG